MFESVIDFGATGEHGLHRAGGPVSGIHEQFPTLSKEECHEKALFLYSGLVGTMSMARTMKDVNLAYQVLAAGRKALIESCVAPENRTPIRANALVNA